MDLNIMGYNDSTIKFFDRWKYDTWQMYIHIQISKLYKGVEKYEHTSELSQNCFH